MPYLDQFVSALQFLPEISDEHSGGVQDEVTLKSVLTDLQSQRQSGVYDEVLELIKKLSTIVIGTLSPEDVVNKCHAVSQSLFEKYNNLASGSFQLCITVGNVIYKGDNLYNLTKDGLRGIIEKGPSAIGSLDLHVWLTLEDMTVIDLSIIPTLVHRGELPESALADPILFWHEGMDSDFEYQPILVDNGFMYKVDRVRYSV
jgi:hypothetical protein